MTSYPSPPERDEPLPVDSIDDTDQRDPLEALAAEFSDRCRRGERVTIEEYARRRPELAKEIRELFPTIRAMERLHATRIREGGLQGAAVPSQLGDYRVIAEIARGGMGIVYEAEQITLGRRVAVKVLPQHSLRRTRDVQRFQREAQTAAKLHHSNIVPVFGVGQDQGYHYIVMQLIRGVGLDEILREMKQLVSGESDGSPVTRGRSSTVKRSAIGLLGRELQQHSTRALQDAETVVADGDTTPADQTTWQESPPPDLLQIRAAVGRDYYHNVARIGLQAAQALHYAHRHNTLHRDVKPGNLLLDEDGRVWIADFGLAKAIENDDVTRSGDVVGTLSYVAPERFRGETTERSDIYSLGITLHEMLTFRRAFDGRERVAVMNQVTSERLPIPRESNPLVPADLETIVLKAASYDPADRYRNAGRLAADLEAFLADRPIEARRLSRVEYAVRWCRRNRTVAMLAASVVVLLASVFAATIAGYVNSNRERRFAEATSQVAVGVLEEIYTQFAASDANIPAPSSDEANGEEVVHGHLPLSKDVAFMLENLLRFYDQVPQRPQNSTMLAVKYIASNGRIGDIRRRLGQLDEARKSYDEAINRIEQLDVEVRDSEAVRLESARIHNGLGIVLQQARLGKESSAAHQCAIALLDREGSSTVERFELARSLYLLHRAEAKNHRHRRGAEDSRENLERAKNLLIELEQQYPHHSGYRFLLARCLLEGKSRCGDDGALSGDQDRAIAILESLVARMPDNPDYQFELGEAYRSIEWDEFWDHRKTERSEEQLAKSEQRLLRAFKVTENLNTDHPNIPQYSKLRKGLHHLLAIAYEGQGRLAEAAIQYLRALESQRLVVRQSQWPYKDQFWLLDLQLHYAKLLRRQHLDEDARDLLEQLAADLESLAEHPELKTNGHYRERVEKNLTQTYVTLANALKCLNENERAQALLRRVEEVP